MQSLNSVLLYLRVLLFLFFVLLTEHKRTENVWRKARKNLISAQSRISAQLTESN